MKISIDKISYDKNVEKIIPEKIAEISVRDYRFSQTHINIRILNCQTF